LLSVAFIGLVPGTMGYLAPYAHLRSDAILSSVQERILRVIRARCETLASG
jgi:hypothetical protein